MLVPVVPSDPGRRLRGCGVPPHRGWHSLAPVAKVWGIFPHAVGHLSISGDMFIENLCPFLEHFYVHRNTEQKTETSVFPLTPPRPTPASPWLTRVPLQCL